MPCKACPSWCVRHIAARLEPRASVIRQSGMRRLGFSGNFEVILSPPPPSRRLDIADDSLTTLMDDHALDPDDLRAFASLPIQRVEHVGHAPGKVRAVLPQLRRHFGRLLVHHSPAKALHGAKVHRHRLRGQHAFDFVGRLERPQGRNRSEHLLTASFFCLARRKPAGSGHRVDQHAVKLVAPRPAECAQFVGFGFADEDVSRGDLLFVDTTGAAPPLRFICDPVLRRVCPRDDITVQKCPVASIYGVCHCGTRMTGPEGAPSTPLLHEGHHASSICAVRFACPLARIASSLVHHCSPTFRDGLLGKVLGKATRGKVSLVLID